MSPTKETLIAVNWGNCRPLVWVDITWPFMGNNTGKWPCLHCEMLAVQDGWYSASVQMWNMGWDEQRCPFECPAQINGYCFYWNLTTYRIIHSEEVIEDDLWDKSLVDGQTFLAHSSACLSMSFLGKLHWYRFVITSGQFVHNQNRFICHHLNVHTLKLSVNILPSWKKNNSRWTIINS